jgi:dephospho-CoA kinase
VIFKVGLTGGIGSGKTTVCRLFIDLDVPVIDADEVARDVVAPGQPALTAIARDFGPNLIDSNGGLRREQLRSLVFADDARRRRLEALLHPLIRAEMERRVQALSAPYCILCVPLLLEADQLDLVDRVLVVDSPEELQRRRVIARDQLTEPEVNAIMRTQSTRAVRLRIANDVIVNDDGVEKINHQVASLHQRYLALAAARTGASL